MLSIVATWLLVGAPAPSAQDPEQRVETRPDGGRIELVVRTTADGGSERHGPYRRYYPDGTLAAEGSYAHGALDGPWTSWWPDGTVRTRGTYVEGRRSSKWEAFHPDGGLAATGRYRLGLRDRKWVYLSPEGEKLEQESGFYRTASELYPDRERKLLAELKDERLHGRWLAWWPDGTPMLEGRYREGRRDGRFRFWLLDGSFDPELLSGVYEAGARVGPAEPDPEGPASDPFETPEETSAPAPPPDPARLPRFGRLPGVDSRQRAACAEKVARFLDHEDERERLVAEQLLLQYGRDALPEVLNRLGELDLDVPAEHERAQRLTGLLRGVCKGRGWSLTGGPEGGDPEGDRRAVARWFSWFELARLQEPWWEALRTGTLPAELITMELVDGYLGTEPASRERPEPEAPAIEEAEIEPKLSMLFRRRQFESRPREIREPIERGLEWLARHQDPEGGWDCDGFGTVCERRGLEVCDGAGSPDTDVGVTALALLAFLGDGQTVHTGPHAEVIARGLRWLIAQQDPASGQIVLAAEHPHGAVYGHAMATLVLCEASTFTDSPAVRVPARRAVEAILAAQNPGAAWRYSFTPDGDNDTSVTGWMVQALQAAREADLVDDEQIESALARASAWIDRMTDPKTGRVGYVSPGSSSSRIEKVNDHYPTDGEALTAVGIFAQALCRAKVDEALLERQADLLLMALPRWEPEEPGCDLYYWVHGSEALAQVGGSHWKAWRAAVWRALLGAQREERTGACAGGSWDPVGPWGYAGGRVYATALALLSLEAEFRLPRISR